MALTTGFVTFLILRLLLGIAEAGFFPGILYYITLWYKPEERAVRYGLFYMCVVLAGAVSGFCAYFVLQIGGFLGIEGWQWVFILEGVPSIVGGIIVWFVMPNGPQKASWLSSEEKEVWSKRLELFLHLWH